MGTEVRDMLLIREYYDLDAMLHEFFHDDKDLLEAYAKAGKIIRTEYDTYRIFLI